METKYFRDMPEKEYRALPQISQSQIKKAVKSIGHYLTPFSPSQQLRESMDLGTAFHSEVLTPCDGSWVKGLSVARRSNADKAAWSEFEAKNKGKAILKPDQVTALEIMKSMK